MDREITLETAADTMNVVISLLRQLNEKLDEDLQELQKETQAPWALSQHRDIVLIWGRGKQKSTTDASQPAGFCERTMQLLESCFLEPLLEQDDASALGEPLSFLEDERIALSYSEKALLYSLACQWAITKSYETHSAKDKVTFLPGAEHGTSLNNLLPMVMIHMRSRKELPSWVVYSVQMIADAQEVLGDDLGRVVTTMHETAAWIGAALDSLLVDYPKAINREAVASFRQMLRGAQNDLDCTSLLGKKGVKLSEEALRPEDRQMYRGIPMMSGLRSQMWLRQYQELGKYTPRQSAQEH